MKKVLLLFICCAVAVITLAQKETFDITTYTLPKGWKKQPAEAAIQFSKEDAAKGTYCLITLYKAVPGSANSKENFDMAWASLVKEMVTVAAEPEMQKPETEDGRETQSGYAAFESGGSKGVVILVTSSGYKKMVNLIILTNTDVYEKEMTGFLESVSYKKMENPTTTQEVNTQQTPVTNNDDASILGTWAAGASDNSDYRMKNGIMNSLKRQYSFRTDGTYQFITKAFDPLMNQIILGKESGTYQINGTNVTVNPKKSVLEAWSKKDGTDKWGKLLNTQNIPLENVTYSFTKHYFSGIQIWSLVLIADKPTNRDGPFSNNKSFDNAWYYNPISPNNPVIDLPGGQQITSEEIKKNPVQQKAPDNNATIIGTWGKGNSATLAGGSFGRWSYTKEQYIFNQSGAYSFARKVYVEYDKETLLTRETGTYTINGNKIIINPKTNVIEAWSKINGGDNFKQLISSQKKALEKTTYQFTVQYNMELKDPFLLLIADKETARDGWSNAESIHSPIAWRYGTTPPFTPIKMPN